MGLEAYELVAQARGLLEVKLLARGAHVVLDGGHDVGELVFGQAREFLGHRLREALVGTAASLSVAPEPAPAPETTEPTKTTTEEVTL